MFSRLFRSRWSALIWAAGVLRTAYDVADSAPPPPASGNGVARDATGAAVDPADLAILANAGG